MTSKLRPIGVLFFKIFRVYHNCPLHKPQPVVQCVVYEILLLLSAWLQIAAVMVVAAFSAANLVLELDVDANVPRDDYMLELEGAEDGVEKEDIANG